ncbi:hypothetical protein BD410DRAFT_266400 [Rickenella mellea]|uniref:Ubiquitin-like 1-activating enzyme E1A n=1 Tax=Rickenella mellea TaxID=50990 RepID=A0A4Y7Q481_9AGAM|nr:hypothetical protein BD410DRAFT_266400 [Rickenella mellea]
MSASTGTSSAPLQITEDEAAVYDRQIRLWGLEAQQRMRNATIMVVRLKGVATETIKNIVLAGIGKLVIVDDDDVAPEDLGAGFFFRDEDVGKKRVDAAKARVESLNPLVIVETVPTLAVLEPARLDATVQSADLLCMTDWDRETLIRVNDACRRFNKPFYAGGSYGLLGYIFCDLGQHEYLAPERTVPKDSGNKRTKLTVNYCPLRTALQPYKWSGLNRMQTKNLNPVVHFTIQALWEYQFRHRSALPDITDHATELDSIANSLFTQADINKVIKGIPKDLTESLATTATHEFAPVCAVIGGILGQDLLKALAAREPPIANFFSFDGNSGHGSVCRMNMK